MLHHPPQPHHNRMGNCTTAPDAPASRQKNCNTCVQAKRRCNRRTPVCSRCAEKQLLCVYTRPKAAGPSAAQIPETPLYGNVSPFNSPADSFFGSTNGLSFGDNCGDLNFDLQPDFDTNISPSVLDAPRDTDTPMDIFSDLLDPSIATPSHQWLIPTHESPIDRPSTPIDDEALLAYEKMAPACNRLKPWDIYDPSTPLYHILTSVRSFITTMATSTTTPFLHPLLYRHHKPPSILSCFASCVLYSNRTASNTASVIQHLHASAGELFATEGRDGSSLCGGSNGGVTPTEKLARTQALFLYQVVRLFDGDVSLRAAGERDMGRLRGWLGELCKIRENLGGEDGEDGEREGGSLLEGAGVEWERWIFAESLRRTVVMAYSVMTMYTMLTGSGGKDDLDPWGFTHRWTLSRWLWEASSSSEFQRRWKEEPQFVITNYSFEKFLSCGKGGDVDEFAEILLSVYVGVDETKEFISAG